MNLNYFRDILMSVVVSAGGIAAIIIVAVKFASNAIAEGLQKKYQLKIDKEFEIYKLQVENQKYITQTTFDKEFQIYQEVSSAFFDMVRDISVMIPNGYTHVLADKDARRKDEEVKYKRAKNSVVYAQNVLNRNAPFIAEDIYDGYYELNKLAATQLLEFEERWVVTDLRPQEEKENFSREAYKRTEKINLKFGDISKAVRNYIRKLEVIK